MIISYNKIIGLPAYTPNSKKIGTTNNLIINPEDGHFLGLIISEGGNSNKKIILSENIKEFEEKRTLIKDEKAIKDLDNLENKVKKIIQNNIKIKNNKVYTTERENLGEVSDFEIDLVIDRLSKIYVKGGIIKNLIRGELIISKNQIISIEKDKITVQNIVVKKKQKEKLVFEKEKLAGAGLYIKAE